MSESLTCDICEKTFLSSNSQEKHYSTQKHKTNKLISDLITDNNKLKDDKKKLNMNNLELKEQITEINELKSRINEITQMANEDINSYKLNSKKNKTKTTNYTFYSTLALSFSLVAYLLRKHII